MQLLLLNNFSATIDIVALVILIIYALYGLIRGFTKTFFSVFGSIIGVALALLIAPSVISFVQAKFSVLDGFKNSFYGVSKKILGSELYATPLALATKESLNGVAGFIANALLSLKNNANVSADATIGQALATIFAYYALLIICGIIVFIILKCIFYLISEVVKKAYKNKFVATFDRSLGLALGFINGIFTLEIIILLIGILPIPFCQQIIININDTALTRFIQNINLYQLIINNVINGNVLGEII